MKILISTDTSCLINNEFYKKLELSVFPLNVIIDGEEFLDGVTINQDDLKVAMRAGKKIQTSTPPLGEVIEYFEGLFAKGYDHVIHFTISSELSSMNELFNNVAKSNFEGKVTVINSLGLSAAMLAQVMQAYDDANSGKPLEEIIKNVEMMRDYGKVVFVPENLTALKNGGRISPTIAAIGNAIGIKPVIELIDGKLEKSEMTRKVKLAFIERMNDLSKKYPSSEFDYAFVDFDAIPSTYEYLYEQLQKVIEPAKLIKGVIPINVCAHCGPGTMGLIVTKKINGKSLNTFIG